jgi:hypothetical protein
MKLITPFRVFLAVLSLTLLFALALQLIEVYR